MNANVATKFTDQNGSVLGDAPGLLSIPSIRECRSPSMAIQNHLRLSSGATIMVILTKARG